MGQEEIDETFAALTGALEAANTDAEGTERYVVRDGAGFVVTLPRHARELVAQLAEMLSEAMPATAPVLFTSDDGADDAGADDEALAGAALATIESEDAARVAATAFATRIDAEDFRAWLRLLNRARALITAGITDADQMERLRASRSEAAALLAFVSAVQHELLDALM